MSANSFPSIRPAAQLPALLGIVLVLCGAAALSPAALIASARADVTLTSKQAKEMKAEEKLGADAAADVAKQSKFVTDPAIVGRVQAVGARIAAVADTTQVPAGFGNDEVYPFKYEYNVIDSKEINAFSIPGGHIYIYRGMLDLLQTDDELAAVLGHETAHAAHHHVVKLMHEAGKMDTEMLAGVVAMIFSHVPADQMGALATGLSATETAILNNHFSEAAEEDADHTGMIYMQKAGYDPEGMVTMLERLRETEEKSPEIDLGYLQDHPLTPQRIAAAKAELTDLGVPDNYEKEWRASGAMVAKVVDTGDKVNPGVEIVLGDRPVAMLSPENRREADDAAATLNELMAQGLRIDQVRADGNEVIAARRVLLAFSPDDVRIQPFPRMATDLARDAADAIENKIWEVEVVGISAH